MTNLKDKQTELPAQDRPRLMRSTSIVSSLTMVSRLLGFLRDIILAQTFGAGPAFDAFVVAFKIPNFMRRLFAEGAFAQAFVPILSEYRSKQDHEMIRLFISKVSGMLSLAIIILILLVEVATPVVILLFAPGFWSDPERHQLAVHMLHVTFPYLLFISLVAFSGAVLNTYQRFAIPAFTPVLLNVALIGVALLWAPHTATPIYTLAWGVVIGGCAQLMIQLPSLHKLKLLPRPRLDWHDSGVRRVMTKMVPALFGVSVAQISVLIDNFFASFLPAGSISWLYYSDRLIYLPLGVIGVALATVVMPTLSRQYSSGSKAHYRATLDWALRCVLVIGIPAAVGLCVLAGPILVTLIYRGAFTIDDVMMTRRSLMAFSVGLPAFMLIKVLASAFYARQNIATVVKIAATALIVNLALNLALIIPLAHAGLALATSLSSWLNAILLLVLLIRYEIYQPRAQWAGLFVRIIVANSVMAALLWWFMGPLSQWFTWPTWHRALHLLVTIIVALGLYVSVLVLSGLRARDFKPDFT